MRQATDSPEQEVQTQALPEGYVPADPVRQPIHRPTIAGYEIVDVLGKGGMGVVYKAQQLHPRRTVALKMIRAGECASDEAVQRFRTEIEAAAQLQHVNIVHLYELGTAGELPFFTMEYVDGGSLDRAAAQRTFSCDESAALVEELARAVQYAHERGIIHRDLKPSNVLFTREGRPKITDFGLAKLAAPSGDSPPTQAGAVMGTPNYMAPEQAAGDSAHAGPAADIYALGVILYELLTGSRLFSGDNVVQHILREEPTSPTRLKPALHRDLETICLKCLRKDPLQRYATALDLADDLRRHLERLPIRGRRPTLLERVKTEFHYRPRRAISAAAAVLAAVVAIGGVVYADAYVVEHVSYYNGWTKQWGVPVGIRRLSDESVRRRKTSYKFVRQGRFGPLVRAEAVDSRQQPTSDHETGLWIDGIRAALPVKTREHRYEFRYNPQGFIAEEIGYVSGSAQPLWRLQYDYPNDAQKDPRRQVLAKFIDHRGAVISDRAGAGALEFYRNATGLDELVKFVDHRGNPRQAASSEQLALFDGVHAVEVQYHADGQVARMTFRDAEGNAMPNLAGVFQLACGHDDQGQLHEMRFFDDAGKPTLSKSGHHRVTYSHDDAGNRVAERYWDVDGRPAAPAPPEAHETLAMMRVSSVQHHYDDAGRLVLTQGRVRGEEPVYELRWRYPEGGDRFETRQLHGTAGVREKHVNYYDRQGDLVTAQQWGPGGKRLRDEVRRKFNDQRLVIEEVQTNLVTEQEMSRTTWSYDPKTGQKLTESRWDQGGKTLLGKTTWTYDELGRQEVETRYGRDGAAEIEKVAYRYQNRTGRLLERTTVLQEGGRPVTLTTAWTYNPRGEIETEVHRDAAGNERPGKEGYSRLVKQFTPYGRLVQETFTGYAPERGFAKMVKYYDGDRRNSATRYFDDRDEPATAEPLGYSEQVIRYDKLGWSQETELSGYRGQNFAKQIARVDPSAGSATISYYDEQGRQVRHSNGYLTRTVHFDESVSYMAREVLGGYDLTLGFDSRTNVYDPSGRVVERSFHDAQGALVRGPEGFARGVFTDDLAQNATSWSYFDEHGQPARHRDGNTKVITYWDEQRTRIVKKELGGFEPSRGYFSQATSYDDAGRTTQVAHFGPDGRLVRCPAGYARVECQYSAQGELLGVTYWDAEDRPMAGRSEVVVVSVAPGGAAQRLAIQPGDVVKSYHGLAVASKMVLLNEQERVKDQSQDVELEIERDGRPLEVLHVPVGKIGIVLEDRFIPDAPPADSPPAIPAC